jgi:hypothetical protein
MVIIFKPLLNVRDVFFGQRYLFSSTSGEAYGEVPGVVAFSFDAAAVGFATAQSPFDERSADDFTQGRKLLDNLFSADEQGLFGVHTLHIYECKKSVKPFSRKVPYKNGFIAN